jgi:hypothetical protein
LTYFFFLVVFFAFFAAFFFVAITSPPSRQPIDSLGARCYFLRPRERAYRLQSAAAERLMGHTFLLFAGWAATHPAISFSASMSFPSKNLPSKLCT